MILELINLGLTTNNLGKVEMNKLNKLFLFVPFHIGYPNL